MLSKPLCDTENPPSLHEALTPSGQNAPLSVRPPASLVRINDCGLARAMIEEGIRVAKRRPASRCRRQTLLIRLEPAVPDRIGPELTFDAKRIVPRLNGGGHRCDGGNRRNSSNGREVMTAHSIVSFGAMPAW